MVTVRVFGRFILQVAIFVLKLLVAFAVGLSIALIGLGAGHYIPHYYRR